jgi:RNA polymerase-binding transcription factor DksA/very-short-patch-repair endonuclease
MTLVSSMRPDHLDRTVNSRNDGPRMLASYVRYASRGGRFEEDHATTDPDAVPGSEFEEAVAAALTARGFEVRPQVGVSEFRIDLGIVHPEIPTRFILGVECDGVAYHSSRTARDRDRLRQEILESLGWKIHRIWSTDWVQHPDTALDRLIDRINELVSASEIGVLAAPLEPGVSDALEAPTPVEDAREVAEAPASMGIQVLPATDFIEEQRASMVVEVARLNTQLSELRAQHGVLAQQPDRGFTLQQVERSLLQQKGSNQEALKRIEAGRYGICLNCRTAIELDRLEARPSAELCRVCSQGAKR